LYNSPSLQNNLFLDCVCHVMEWKQKQMLLNVQSYMHVNILMKTKMMQEMHKQVGHNYLKIPMPLKNLKLWMIMSQ
jgi:hypothetical protein